MPLLWHQIQSADIVLSRLNSILLKPGNKSQQKKLEIELAELIGERNSVFHQGRPTKFSSKFLADTGLILARQILHQLRLRIKTDNIQTKDELIAWAKGN